MRDCATFENHIKKSASEKPRRSERRIARSRRAAATAAPSRLGALETGGVSGLEWQQDRSKAGDPHCLGSGHGVCWSSPADIQETARLEEVSMPELRRFIGLCAATAIGLALSAGLFPAQPTAP